jgi:peptidoglycan/LPS O-acetylase OafA/YrhL
LLPGNIAVELFFMISGFYMSLVLTERYDPQTWRGIATFYQSRFLRLWPTFALTTLVVYMWWAISALYLGRTPANASPFHLLDNSLASAALMFSNLFMIGQDIPSLFHVNGGGAALTFGPAETLGDGSLWLGYARNIEQAWSVGTEIWFYLLIPFLARTRTSILVALMAASGTLRFLMAEHGLSSYFFFPAQFGLFLAGVLAHRFGASGPLGCRATAIFCLIVVGGGCLAFGSTVGLSQDLKWVLYAAFAVTMHALFRWSNALPLDRLIGELSYPVYITHMIVGSIAVAIGRRLGISVGGGILLLLVLPLSWLLVMYVELPIAGYRARLAKLRGNEVSESSISSHGSTSRATL